MPHAMNIVKTPKISLESHKTIPIYAVIAQHLNLMIEYRQAEISGEAE